MGLGARLALVFAAVAAATALVVGGASYVTTDRQVTAEIDQFLEQRASEIADGQREQPGDRRDRQENNNDNGQVVVAVSADAEVQVLDERGEVVSNSGRLLPVNANDRALAQQGGRYVLRTVTLDGHDYRMITETLKDGGAVQVARSLEESASLLTAIQSRTLVIAAAVALLAAGAGWVLAQRTTRPLRALTAAVADVAETRDFSTPVPRSGNDEVGQLADGFNHMLGTLAQSQAQQRRLVQDAAHELRTPLTSVTANVEWLLRISPPDPNIVEKTLTGVRRELGELNHLMAEIIELATDSHEPPDLVPIDLADVADGAVSRFSQRSGRQVNLTRASAMVMGDPDSLARAVTNLLGNADKYSPQGNPVALEVGPGGLFVDDAGPGIPLDERELVFQRFYRRDEDRALPGSGLGLAIVADVVDQHGGTVAVSDSSLGGARVGFTLPSVEASWAPPAI